MKGGRGRKEGKREGGKEPLLSLSSTLGTTLGTFPPGASFHPHHQTIWQVFVALFS